MKEAIISIITDYLKDKETDYALMINGAWGSGKTYFIKHALKTEIERVECPIQKDNDKKKTYKQIYVSLYGVALIEEIKERIFYAINPSYKWLEIASNKIVSATEVIPALGTGLKNVLSCSNKEKEKIRNAITNYVDKVLFFDDLERIDKNKIDIQSVLGYINSLTEHNHYKVIVVANDEVLGDDYKQFKEKTVRFSYNYLPNLSEIFDNIIKETESKYKSFLEGTKDFLLEVINAGNCVNIRTFIFIIDTFQKLFHQINGKYENEICKDLLLPFSIISIEAKNGHTKEELKESLPYILSFSSLLEQGKIELDLNDTDDNVTTTNNQSKEKYEKSLKSKYERFNKNLTFYSELYDLAFDGYASNERVKHIVENIRNQHIQAEETEEIKLLKQIRNWTYIPDENFFEIISKCKDAVRDNKYKVYDLLQIYASFLQLESLGIEGFSVSEEETNVFKTAIDNAINQYFELFDIKCPLWDSYDKSTASRKYNEMRNYAIEKNIQLKSISDSNQIDEILSLIKDNNIEKFKQFMSEINNRFLFMSIDPKDIITAVNTANPETKSVFYYGLTSFFMENLTNPSLDDIDYLEKLNAELKNFINNQETKKVSHTYIIYAHKYIEKVLRKYKILLN